MRFVPHWEHLNTTRPYVKGYVDIIRPLSNLTKKDKVFIWTPQCMATIHKLKELVWGDPVLMHPDHDCPFTLKVDASQFALGAVLSQHNDQGRLQLVGYYSKTLIPTKRNYDVYDQELLAMVWSLEHWQHLLMGTKHPIKVFTDHKWLTKYWHSQKIRRQVAQYLPILEEYHLQIKHHPDAANRVDDTLSWTPWNWWGITRQLECDSPTRTPFHMGH